MTTKFFSMAERSFIFISALSLGYVALLAWVNPQSVMDLVGVRLDNTDALSSIRGVYGGVGITIVVVLVYLGIFQTNKGIDLLTLFWGSYSISRFITWIIDGPLGEFGTTWLFIESVFCAVGLVLIFFRKKIVSV